MPKFPSNIEAEQALIGSLMIAEDNQLLTDCQGMGITANSFFHPNHQILFSAINHAVNDGRKTDMIEIVNQLQREGKLEVIGGFSGVSDFFKVCETITQALRWAEIVREAELRRELVSICTIVGERASMWDKDFSQTAAYLNDKANSLGKTMTGDKTLSLAQVHKKYEDVIKLIMEGQKLPMGINTGYTRIDSMTRGLRKKTMTILAARPSVGKTSLAVNMIYNIISKNHKARVLFFTLEMDDWSIYEKMISGATGISSTRIRDGLTNSEQRNDIVNACKEINAADSFINDSSDLNSTKIRSIARQMHSRKPVDLIVVDYLQFVKAAEGTTTREQQVSEISRSMKSMAKELDCPVIVLSQLSRDSEKGERRPRLSDLRDSGAIEQDADIVEMLWNNREEGCVEMLVAKNRVGATGIIKLNFNASATKFTELSENV